MSLYEHVFISRQDLSIPQAEGLIEHFSTILSENGGKVLSQEYWGLKTMAYKINKNRKGHYVLLKSDSPPEAVEEMETGLIVHNPKDEKETARKLLELHMLVGPTVQSHN